METKRKDIKTQLQQGYKLQTLMHMVNKETLREQHKKQQTGKAKGVDGVTKSQYDFNLENNLDNLLTRTLVIVHSQLEERIYQKQMEN